MCGLLAGGDAGLAGKANSEGPQGLWLPLTLRAVRVLTCSRPSWALPLKSRQVLSGHRTSSPTPAVPVRPPRHSGGCAAASPVVSMHPPVGLSASECLWRNVCLSVVPFSIGLFAFRLSRGSSVYVLDAGPRRVCRHFSPPVGGLPPPR